MILSRVVFGVVLFGTGARAFIMTMIIESIQLIRAQRHLRLYSTPTFLRVMLYLALRERKSWLVAKTRASTLVIVDVTTRVGKNQHNNRAMHIGDNFVFSCYFLTKFGITYIVS